MGGAQGTAGAAVDVGAAGSTTAGSSGAGGIGVFDGGPAGVVGAPSTGWPNQALLPSHTTL